MKIALCLIVKGSDDEAGHLDNCLKSVHKHVDGIFLNINAKKGEKASQSVLDVAHKYTDNIIETEWQDNFAQARNQNLAQVPKDYDWVLWLDSDDKVKNPAKIRKVAEASQKYDAIYADYLYDRDEAGNPLTVHMVARLFKNNGSHQWKGRIHETLIETRGATQGATKDFEVIHQADDQRKDESLKRNIKLLEKQLEEEAKDPDPRTIYYLASTYMDIGELETAKQLFTDYLTLSGWDQERSAALTKLGKIEQELGNTSEAKIAFMRAIGEDPEDPEPRVEIGSLELSLKQYNKCRIWLEGVEKMEKNMTTLERNPMSYTFRTYLLLAECYLNMGGKWLDKADKYAQKALKYKKDNKAVVEFVQMVGKVNKDRKELQEVIEKYKKLKDKGKKKKALELLEALPDHLSDNPLISQLKQSDKPFKWPQKSIAIMTGDTAIDEWGPWSLKEGIGGSEEAVIRLSRQLAKRGYKVVVYGKPGPNTGLDESGVMWRNYWDCNLNDEFDIFVAWRAPFIFDRKIKARKSYLWLHDVMEAGEFTPPRLANLTKVIVLSKYHRSLFPMIPDEKILLSANGIDPEDFEKWDDKVKRNPHKIIYTSSHVRGLAYVYEIWKDVKKAVPEATLDVYYGRESYDAVHKGNPERMKWMDGMIAKAKELDGVTDHGKVGQDEINQHIFESGVWVYPCVTGDTLVDMPRDYSKYPMGIPIRKLVGKKNFPVWSFNEQTGRFELKNVNWVAKTRKNAEIIKINWTDGTSLRCTPDHKIYTYKRGWVPAKDLAIGESAVALKKHAMFQVSAGQGKWPYEHRMIAQYMLGEIPKGFHVHHKDGNHLNNEPSNLEILSPSDHAKETYKEQFSTKALIERRKANLAKYRATDKGKKQLSEIGRKRSKKFWDNLTPEARAEFISRRSMARYNHKVESIEKIGNEDVYDMNVDDNHNFIAGGVVVHNCPFPEIYCITALKMQAGGAVPVSSNFAALDETVQYGVKLPMQQMQEGASVGETNEVFLEDFKKELIDMLKNPDKQEKIRKEMKAWARKQSWAEVSKQWISDIQS